jgi:hypothetical protein
MKRQRGSAMLFVLLMTISITSIVVATGDLAYSAVSAQERQENAAKARCAADAAVAKAISQVKTNALVTDVEAAVAMPVTDVLVLSTSTDYSATIPQSIKVSSTSTIEGRPYAATAIVGNRAAPKPSYYALFSNDALSIRDDIAFGSSGSDGDICCNANISLTGSTYVNGDCEASGTISIPALKVWQNVLPNLPTVNFSMPTRSTYQSAANTTFNTDQVRVLWTFFSPYSLVFIKGKLSLSGVISGVGTIYCTGDVDIAANTSYASSGSRLAIISEGRVTIANTCTSFVGYFYSKAFKATGTLPATLTQGGIAAQSVDISRPMTIIHDPAVFTSSTEGVNLKLPGFWP